MRQLEVAVMTPRVISCVCLAMMVIVWAVDMISTQLLVVAILLSAPIALSSTILKPRLTYQLIAVALLADACAGWFNAYHDAYQWNPIAIGDRVLAAGSILLVGILSIQAQRAALHAGEMSQRNARSEVIRELIYALSHDLRTPLAASGMTMRQALGGAYGDLPDAYRDILSRSIASNEEVYRLAETLLLVARYESGEQSTRRDVVDVAQLARCVVAELQPLYQFKAIESSVHTCKPIFVSADEGELKRAITNLVANSVSGTPQGGKIEVRVEETAAGAVIAVQDNGYGVPEALRCDLFKRFAVHSGRGGGTGLGLYIARRIAEGHGGTAAYEPVVPHGSVFTLLLPISAQAH